MNTELDRLHAAIAHFERKGYQREQAINTVHRYIHESIWGKSMSNIIHFNPSEISALQKFAAQSEEDAELALLDAGFNNKVAAQQNELLYGVIDQLHAAQKTQAQAFKLQGSANAKLRHGEGLKGYIRRFFPQG